MQISKINFKMQYITEYQDAKPSDTKAKLVARRI